MVEILDGFMDILGEGVKVVEFFLDLFPSLERVFMIVDWNFLVVDHSKKLSKDVVLVRLWSDDSLDEMSMKSVRGIFLRGFWVEELALEAMEYGVQGMG
ncbi:hypothetical protein Tco_0646676 [Tanacetum coccineum]